MHLVRDPARYFEKCLSRLLLSYDHSFKIVNVEKKDDGQLYIVRPDKMSAIFVEENTGLITYKKIGRKSEGYTLMCDATVEDGNMTLIERDLKEIISVIHKIADMRKAAEEEYCKLEKKCAWYEAEIVGYALCKKNIWGKADVTARGFLIYDAKERLFDRGAWNDITESLDYDGDELLIALWNARGHVNGNLEKRIRMSKKALQY